MLVFIFPAVFVCGGGVAGLSLPFFISSRLTAVSMAKARSKRFDYRWGSGFFSLLQTLISFLICSLCFLLSSAVSADQHSTLKAPTGQLLLLPVMWVCASAIYSDPRSPLDHKPPQFRLSINTRLCQAANCAPGSVLQIVLFWPSMPDIKTRVTICWNSELAVTPRFPALMAFPHISSGAGSPLYYNAILFPFSPCWRRNFRSVLFPLSYHYCWY